jgi:NADH-quinone oxidoreductase subunit L
MTFWGESRVDHHVAEHMHPSPATMAVPLVVLILLSIAGGGLLFVIPEKLAHGKIIDLHEHHTDYVVVASGILAAVVGVGAGIGLYSRFEKTLAESTGLRNLPGLLDEIYDKTIVLPLNMTAFVCWLIVDRMIIDNFLITQSTGALYRGAGKARAVQSGAANAAVGVLAAGAAVLIGMLVYGWWKRHG